MKSKLLPVLVVLAASLGSTPGALGYWFLYDDTNCVSTWREGTIPMQVKLDSNQVLTDGTTQAQSILAAMQEWNPHISTVQFVGTVAAPGSYGIWDGTSEIVMDSAINSDGESVPFGEYVLAVTISFEEGNTTSESDIIFNSNYQWDSYRGGQIGEKHDIRRVAAHELGHVLGLDHPDERGQYLVALMNSVVSYVPSIEEPQDDDLAGAQELYGYPGFVVPNDDFGDATEFFVPFGGTAKLIGSNVGATQEPGEPNLDPDDPGGRTIWWSWRATASGSIVVSTSGSNFDTLLGIYTGDSVDSLTQLALKDDDESGIIRTATIQVDVDYGETYYIAVDGWDGVVGTVKADVTLTPDPLRSPPIIRTPPKSQNMLEGHGVSVWCGIESPSGVSFVWKKNGQPLPGKTEAQLTLVPLSVSDSGHYELVATNSIGTSVSYFDLNVIPPTASLFAFGDGSFGQKEIPTIQDVPVSIDAGSRHAAAATYFGYAYGWGANDAGQASIPQWMNDTYAFAAGHQHTLILLKSGSLTNAGGSPQTVRTWKHAWNTPDGIANVIAVDAGFDTSIALISDGSVVSWGARHGDSAPNGLNGVMAIAAGGKHFLALKADGTVVGWGSNSLGEASPPQGLDGVVAIAAGGDAVAGHSLALKSDGTVVAWGSNSHGQTSVPASLSGVVAITAGGSFSLAVKSDGTVVGWGADDKGQLSVPSDLGLPIRVSAGGNFGVALLRPVVPQVIENPESTTVDEGASAEFHVVAHGTPTLKYQWKRFGAPLADGAHISGSKSAHLQISNAEIGDAGAYSVEITNRAGSVVSADAELKVKQPNGITVRPKSRSVHEGDPVTFSVEFGNASAGPYSIQWRHNRRPIPGAVSTTLDLGDATPADAGYYEAIVVNGAGKVYSSVFYLNVAIENAVIAVWGKNLPFTPSVEGLVSTIDFAGALLALKGDGTVVSWKVLQAYEAVVPAGLSGVVGISAGYDHSLAVKSDGTVVGWGPRSTPPPFLSDVVAVSAGEFNSIALRSDGTVVTWGLPSEGSATTSDPFPLPVPAGLKDVVFVAATHDGFFAIRSDGSIVSWGKGGLVVFPSTEAMDIVSIASRGTHYVVVRKDGSVTEWGWNLTPSAPPLSDAISVAAGYRDGIALRSDGTVVGWGSNYFGQASVPAGLGDVVAITSSWETSAALYRASPPVITVQPAGAVVDLGERVVLSAAVHGSLPLAFEWRRDGVVVTDAEGVSGASTSTLVLDPVSETSGGTYVFNATNSLGSAASMPVTVQVKVPPRFVKRPLNRIVSLGGSVTFDGTATDSGTISYQWRRNGSTIPGAVGPTLSLPNVSYSDQGFYEVIAGNSIASNWSSFSLTVAPGATEVLALAAWGSVDGGSQGPADIPSDLGSVVAAAARSDRAVALMADGTVRGWGSSFQQMPANLADVVGVALGQYHSMALLADGRVLSVGSYYGMPPPVPPDLRRVVAIAANPRGNLALRGDGTVVAWGVSAPPVGLSNVTSIALGDGSAYALKADGTVVGWDLEVDQFKPVPAGLTGVKAIAANGGHALALKSDGTVVAWGDNVDGQSNVPAGLANVIAISAGYWHSVALKADGSVVAWGRYFEGANGTRPDLAPVAAITAGTAINLVLTPTLVAPSITSQPQGATLHTGSFLWIKGTAKGLPTPTLQWQKDGQDIAGANGEYFNVNNARIEDSGTYRLVARNSAGIAISNEVEFSVLVQVGRPVFSPRSGTISSGMSVTIESPTPGATIRYTSSEDFPTETHGTIYSAPIVVRERASFRAIAYKSAMFPSEIGDVSYTVTPNSVPVAIGAVLPRGVVDSPLSVTLAGMGGDGGLVWSLASGSPPTGLSLSSSGVISGAPASAGTSTFVVRVSDRDEFTGPADEDTLQLAITVDATNEVPAITTASLPDAGLSLAYSANLAGSGGNGPLTWTKASGNLPPGLTLSEGGLISGIPQALGTFTFAVRVVDDDTITGSTDEATKELSITVVPAPRLTNVSMRAFAGSGDDTLVVGFHIAGTGQKTVLIRGVGPKLLEYNVPSVVADPSITLYRDKDPLVTNNDWEASLAPVFIDAGAFALDVGSKDSAMTATLAPGGYTIHLVNNGPVDTALIEVYDISRDAGTRLVNVSSRLRFQPGQLAILGTAVTGGPLSVLARNVGPGIAEYLVNPLDALPDPHLRLYAGQAELAVNQDWDPALLPFFGAAGAFPIDEGSKDAAIRAQFQLGLYSVHATGNGGEGVAIIEIYESP